MDNKRKPILALDTSTSAMSVAIMDGSHLLIEDNSRAERNHSIHLLPIIQRLLVSEQLTVADLHGIAIGRGPGSYTGVRIGVTVGKTLAWANNIPLMGISSLETLAYGALEKSREGSDLQSDSASVWVVPMQDARRGQVYTGLFAAQTDGQAWVRLAEDRIMLLEEGLRRLNGWMNGEVLPDGADGLPDHILFVGEVDRFSELLQAFAANWSGNVTLLEYEIHAQHLGQLAMMRWEQGESQDPHSFVPNYTQLSEAEANLKSAQK